jgi:lysophospholipase L1-like esterase
MSDLCVRTTVKTVVAIAVGLLSFAASIFHPAIALAQANQTASLPLDEGFENTALDVSGNGNHGRLLNGAAWTPGRTNGAVSFDGVDDNLVIDGSTTISSITSGITVAAWVYRATNQGGGVAVISRQLGTQHLDHWIFGFIDGQYRWFVNTSDGYSNTNLGGDAPLGQWVHVVGTYDGGFVRLYVNGVEQFSTPHSGVFPVDSTGITVGAGHNDDGRTPVEAFNGMVDDLQVYGGGLSVAEVQALYVSSGGPATGAPPAVSMTSPAGGLVKGTIVAAATASDDHGVVGVQFMVDGYNAGAEDTIAPYAVYIDTTQYARGYHALSAVARDADGNVIVSAPVDVVFDHIAIMPLGDSLTSGVIIQNGVPNHDDGGYRRYLWERLSSDGFEGINFVGSLQNGIPTMDSDHEGHSGWTAEQLNWWVADWITTYQPDVVLLMAGLNDLNLGATPSLVLNRLETLLDQIHSLRPDAKIVLANQPGVLENNWRGTNPEAVVELNWGIPYLVSARAQQGWNIVFADLYNFAGLDRSPSSYDFSPDGVHLSLAGYSKLANVWYAALGPS